MFLRALATAACLLVAAPATSAPIDDLMEVLGLPSMIEIMREEGITYGADLAEEMRPGGADAAWGATVQTIYDPDAMRATVRTGMQDVLAQTDLAPLIQYFSESDGARIVALELSARRAMVDADVEEAARDVYRGIAGSDDGRLGLVSDFVTANDLVEANVTGALNASFNFYAGMADGGALDLSETEILSIIWQSEPETRADTQEWVFSFLLMAYGPLEDQVVRDYTAFSKSAEGAALNRALFAGFNEMYDQISYALGRALARDLEAQEL